MDITQLDKNIIYEISEKLTDYDKLKFSETCKFINNCKTLFNFNKYYYVTQIINCIDKYKFKRLIITFDEHINKINNHTERLRLRCSYTQHMDKLKGLLIKYLYIENDIKYLLDDIMPKSVKYLYIDAYGIDLKKIKIPDTIETLILDEYDKEINPNDLPNSITRLKLKNYHYPLQKNIIPNSVKCLLIKNFFDNNIITEGSLPTSLIDIYIGDNINIPLNDIPLPNSIKIIKLGPRYSHPISNLPKNIEELHLHKKYNIDDINLPSQDYVKIIKHDKKIIIRKL